MTGMNYELFYLHTEKHNALWENEDMQLAMILLFC